MARSLTVRNLAIEVFNHWPSAPHRRPSGEPGFIGALSPNDCYSLEKANAAIARSNLANQMNAGHRSSQDLGCLNTHHRLLDSHFDIIGTTYTVTPKIFRRDNLIHEPRVACSLLGIQVDLYPSCYKCGRRSSSNPGSSKSWTDAKRYLSCCQFVTYDVENLICCKWELCTAAVTSLGNCVMRSWFLGLFVFIAGAYLDFLDFSIVSLAPDKALLGERWPIQWMSSPALPLVEGRLKHGILWYTGEITV